MSGRLVAGGLFAIMVLCAPPVCATDNPTGSVLILIERGRMDGQPRNLELATEAARAIILAQAPTVEIALLSHDGHCGSMTYVDQSFTQDHRQVLRAVERLRVGSGTPLAEALSQSLTYIRRHARGRVVLMYCLGTGRDECDTWQSSLEEYYQVGFPLQVNTVNLPVNDDPQAMARLERLATVGQGEYKVVDSFVEYMRNKRHLGGWARQYLVVPYMRLVRVLTGHDDNEPLTHAGLGLIAGLLLVVVLLRIHRRKLASLTHETSPKMRASRPRPAAEADNELRELKRKLMQRDESTLQELEDKQAEIARLTRQLQDAQAAGRDVRESAAAMLDADLLEQYDDPAEWRREAQNVIGLQRVELAKRQERLEALEESLQQNRQFTEGLQKQSKSLERSFKEERKRTKKAQLQWENQRAEMLAEIRQAQSCIDEVAARDERPDESHPSLSDSAPRRVSFKPPLPPVADITHPPPSHESQIILVEDELDEMDGDVHPRPPLDSFAEQRRGAFHTDTPPQAATAAAPTLSSHASTATGQSTSEREQLDLLEAELRHLRDTWHEARSSDDG